MFAAVVFIFTFGPAPVATTRADGWTLWPIHASGVPQLPLARAEAVVRRTSCKRPSAEGDARE